MQRSSQEPYFLNASCSGPPRLTAFVAKAQWAALLPSSAFDKRSFACYLGRSWVCFAGGAAHVDSVELRLVVVAVGNFYEERWDSSTRAFGLR